MKGESSTDIVVRVLLIIASFATISMGNSDRPHIIYILADDLGWNDVSFHGSPQIPTPNIDALAASGVILHNFYTAHVCSPSRGSLMTGRYPFNIGLQHLLIFMGEPSGLPLNFTIMPEYFKDLGYSTNLIGKWHLGSFKKEYTPTHRGFDKFFGFYAGRIDYFDYTSYYKRGDMIFWGVDLHDGEEVVKDFRGKYATELFTEKAVDVIKEHNVSQPLFLYLSTIAPHSGNPYAELQALPEDVAKFKHIKNLKRRTYAGAVAKLDESVGKVFQALSEMDMLNNSIIIFSGDNGGPSVGPAGGQASNWPLRGEKYALYEGSVRVPAFIWSPLLGLKEPTTSQHLMHISDWLPTLYHAAGGNIDDLNGIDGTNMWPHFLDNGLSPRNELPLNIDPIFAVSAIRVGDYKLIQGKFPEKANLRYGPSGREEIILNSSLDEWVWKDGSVVKDILEKSNLWLLKSADAWRVNLTVHCADDSDNAEALCDPAIDACLFNIVRDPCEQNNLASQYPKIVKKMKDLIRNYNSTAWPPINKPLDPMGDPLCHGFAYVPWMGEESESDCHFS